MLLNKLRVVDSKWYTDRFRRTIEDHRKILLSGSSVRSIESETSIKYNNNYYGLLTSINIPAKYHFTVMRINNIVNPRLSGMVTSVHIPEYTAIDKLVSILEQKEKNLF